MALTRAVDKVDSRVQIQTDPHREKLRTPRKPHAIARHSPRWQFQLREQREWVAHLPWDKAGR